MTQIIVTTQEQLSQIIFEALGSHFSELKTSILSDRKEGGLKIPRYFSRKQVASHLGICLSMVDKLASSGKLTRRKVGSKTVFASGEVEALTGERNF
jgi:hypothetical protein